MPQNGNRHDSGKEQVLYILYDHHEKFIWYFGITSEKPGADDLTLRIRTHVKRGNRFAGFQRYSARIVKRSIDGRIRGRAVEDDMIRQYRLKHGQPYPRGNEDHRFLSDVERLVYDALIREEE